MADSKVPTSKVSAAGLAGAVVTIAVFVAGYFGIAVPPEVAAALTTIAAFGAGYIKA